MEECVLLSFGPFLLLFTNSFLPAVSLWELNLGKIKPPCLQGHICPFSVLQTYTHLLKLHCCKACGPQNISLAIPARILKYIINLDLVPCQLLILLIACLLRHNHKTF